MAPGELVALLGPSGCGKTTALRLVAGLEQADSGRVVVGGADVTGQPTNKRDVGMVFQAYSLFPHLTAWQNVAFGLQMRKVDARQRRQRAGEMLELVGLSGFADRFAHQLSGGQQQRVALARALAIQPKVLLLDEPLSALDAKVRARLRDEIRRVQLEVGITTLFVTHDQEEALAIADRVGVMHSGRIEQLGPPTTIYSRPATPFVAEFVGLPGAPRGGNRRERWRNGGRAARRDRHRHGVPGRYQPGHHRPRRHNGARPVTDIGGDRAAGRDESPDRDSGRPGLDLPGRSGARARLASKRSDLLSRRCGRSSATSAVARWSATAKSPAGPDIPAQPGRSAMCLRTVWAFPGGGSCGRTASWRHTVGRSRRGGCAGRALRSERGAVNRPGSQKSRKHGAGLNTG